MSDYRLDTARHIGKTIFHLPQEYRPEFERYSQEDEQLHIDILRARDTPTLGETCYGSIGISQFDNELEIEGQPLRVEILAVCASQWDIIGHGIAACGFQLASGYRVLRPDIVCEGVLSGYNDCITTTGLLLTAPFSFEHTHVLSFPSFSISWLQAIPITQSECEFVLSHEHSAQELLSLFEAQQLKLNCLDRDSVHFD
ncbi:MULTISPECIES: suppressor of fused domain protein [unclassified Pseudoclavibacter]|uniref:suppressor of fused domain protein n=1 Tax=unclassified Pseudoclavibacter TaxID=2615177 RepID=UPI0013013165|nr:MULTISPECIES: suppressor of fused domain protein [unclassified Pseudoclavibacter]KAB1645473.1 suppressor of fused domain protein [Pseudoclavibacter sp. CFCC 14310]KAB1646068.1 suppressor of fused domain protein [Pseudoclavibacter sp. CFCC 14310]KAB1663624.1 suppressor of fused domain protein [Pseudoclavibacter sp. CFCC 13611]